MADEFQESDVVFTGNNIIQEDEYCLKSVVDSDSAELRRTTKRKKVEKETRPKPKAVNIPMNLSLRRCYMEPMSLYEYECEGKEEDGELMVPPHVMVRRRLAEKMAFSVCYGIGRTLKGRDMSEMRNSVLRMTGFLET